MKKFILFVLFLGVVFSFTNIALADTSNIAKLVFITEPQTIAPNEVSKNLTLQIQDALGNKVPAPETIRFDVFQTTSPTGASAFVSCTTPTKSPTNYLSTGDYNKSICYKDSTEGVYTITAKTNNTINSLVATQEIKITSVVIPPDPPSEGTTTLPVATSTATSSTPSNNSGGSCYVYSSSVSLSTYEPLNLNVEAGRERLGFLHTPLEFKAYSQDKKTGKSISGARYYWTFGDGSSAEGNVVSHTYLFAGTYNVVLNSSSGEEDAVDITKVKIIEPKVKMVYTDFYVEFINENSTDLNIGGWKIKGNDREYLLPRDTIISANGNMKIPFSMLGSVSESDKLGVVYPDNQLAFETSKVLGEEKQKQITEISQKLAMLQEELNLTYAGENNLTQFTGIEDGRLISENDVNKSEGGKGESEISNTDLANSLSSGASASVLSKIVDFFAGMFR
jgi:hypothetical protein